MNRIKFLWIGLFLLISSMLFLYSCQQNLENMINEESIDVGVGSRSLRTEFIDVDFEKLANRDEYTLNLYKEARQRIDEIAEFRNGQYYFNVSTADELNISKKLFCHFKQILKNNNERIKDKYIVEIGGRLLEFDSLNPIALNSIMTTSIEGGESPDPDDEDDEWYPGSATTLLGSDDIDVERESFWWGYEESLELTNEQSLEFFGTMTDIYGHGDDFMDYIPDVWGGDLVKYVNGLVMIATEGMYEGYYNEALETGSSYVLFHVYQPDGTPGSPHTYSIKRIE